MASERDPNDTGFVDPFRRARVGIPSARQVIRGVLQNDPLRHQLLRYAWMIYPEDVANAGLDVAERLASYHDEPHEQHLLRSIEGVAKMRLALERITIATGRGNASLIDPPAPEITLV